MTLRKSILIGLLITMNLANADVTPLRRPPALGSGSTLSFTSDIEFGQSRRKFFCDGSAVPIPMSRLFDRRQCCEVVVILPHDDGISPVTLARDVVRTVETPPWFLRPFFIGRTPDVLLKCDKRTLTPPYLQRVFGGLLRIENLVLPQFYYTGDPIKL